MQLIDDDGHNLETKSLSITRLKHGVHFILHVQQDT